MIQGKTILITGANGMVGNAAYPYFSQENTVIATDIHFDNAAFPLEKMDVRDADEVRAMVAKVRPDIILHLAALTSLEECQSDAQNAFDTNTIGTWNVLQAATEQGAFTVVFSSAGVFDGAKGSYDDTDAPDAINIYGLTKMAAEKIALAPEFAQNALIVRPGWMMGGGQTKDKKFVAAIIKQLLAGSTTIYAVNDKAGTPSYTHDVVAMIDALLSRKQQGIFNLTNEGPATRYDVAQEIVRLLGYTNVSVVSVSSDHFKREFFTLRPASEVLENARLHALDLRMPQWREALAAYLDRDWAFAQKAVAEAPAA